MGESQMEESGTLAQESLFGADLARDQVVS